MRDLVQQMRWLEEPEWGFAGDGFWVRTRPDTDYWQRTHYGFRRDNAHALVLPVPPRFRLSARFRFEPRAKYDQCGLLVRCDADYWFKCSVEFETDTASRLGSVVTNAGFSDWATQDVPSSLRSVAYELVFREGDLVAQWAEGGGGYRQMRVAHMATSSPLVAGIYGCSPTGDGFRFEVSELSIEPLGEDAA
jgi:regulation of enolase protein 1 (concanavalin A-like superfamily)